MQNGFKGNVHRCAERRLRDTIVNTQDLSRSQTPDAGLWFTRRYGSDPQGIWFAPGRVNIIGGPDYNEVFVLPFALGFGVSAAASRRTDRRIRLTSRQLGDEPMVRSIDTLEPGSVQGWAAYPAGVAWALREASYLAGGADVAIDSDLPMGAGLSSSAALECSVALALTELYDIHLSRPELAALARQAENQFVGVPSGIMDQSAALLCRADHVLLLDCRSGSGVAVPFNPAAAGLRLLVIDTCIRRTLTDGRYASRRRACDDAALKMGVQSLRDVVYDPTVSGRLIEPILQMRARHVISEYHRVLQATEALRVGDLRRLGELLVTSHLSLRDDFEVSWPEADAAVEAAAEAGALGARMTGGGFGGCAVALVPTDLTEQVRTAVVERFSRCHWDIPRFINAIPSSGARRTR